MCALLQGDVGIYNPPYKLDKLVPIATATKKNYILSSSASEDKLSYQSIFKYSPSKAAGDSILHRRNIKGNIAPITINVNNNQRPGLSFRKLKRRLFARN